MGPCKHPESKTKITKSRYEGRGEKMEAKKVKSWSGKILMEQKRNQTHVWSIYTTVRGEKEIPSDSAEMTKHTITKSWG